MKPKSNRALTPKLRFPEFRDTPGWEESSVVDACEAVTQGGTPDTSNPQYWNGSINWITPAEMGKTDNPFIDSSERKITQAGLDSCSSALLPTKSVIISTRAPIGHLAINDCPMAINQGCKGLIPGDRLLYFFLYCSLLSAKSRLNDMGAGNTFKELSSTALKNFTLLLPSPPEQQKIADCLGSLDELIAAEERKLAALRNHKRGLMQQLFPQPGETQPRLRFPEFRGKGEWEISELGSVSDVRDGTHDLENVSLISKADYEQINKRSKVAVGDILFGMIGTIGNPVLLKSEGFAIKNVALIKEVEWLSNTFVAHLLQSEYMASIFAVLNTGNSQKFIALGKIRGLPVPVPSLPEQHRIADCLSSLDTLITAQAAKIDALKQHKRSLMQQLFPTPEGNE